MDGPLERLCFYLLIRSTQKKQESQRCQKVDCLIFIFFYEATEPIGTKLGRNVHWMAFFSNNLDGFFHNVPDFQGFYHFQDIRCQNEANTQNLESLFQVQLFSRF